jgi:hypothetical protein
MRIDKQTDMTKLAVNLMVTVLLRSIGHKKSVCLSEVHIRFSKIYEHTHRVAGKHKLLYNIVTWLIYLPGVTSLYFE